MRSVSAALLCLFVVSLSPNRSSQLNAQSAQIDHTTSGVTATFQGSTLQVVALDQDKLRIRAWQAIAPEDASWAVLPASRTHRATVTADPHGFHTTTLAVEIGDNLSLTIRDTQGHLLQRDATPVRWDGNGFEVIKQRADNEHFFGLGDKPGPLDRTGQSFTMWNSDSFGWQESTDPIYKSIPFFLDAHDGRYVGILFDNTWRTWFDFGHKDDTRYSFGSQGGPLDYYFLYGPDPKQVLASYAWLTGPAPLPPLWSFGYQQSRYTYSPKSELLGIADRLRHDRIPADALWLDIDFQKDNMPFTVDPVRFSDFPDMVSRLAKDHFHLVVIADLHIAHKPNAGYAPYDSGTAGDHFVKNPDGTPYVGPVWPGPAVFPDFTRQQSRQWFGTLYRGFLQDGVAGFWDDMNEPAVFSYPSKTMPLEVVHRIEEPGFQTRTASHREIHNLFGMQNSRATYEGVLALRPNERPYVMTRASYAGGQRYAVTWTGDNSSTWNHLHMTVPQLMNLGLSGFSFAGADVGGFAGSPSPNLLTAWLELAAFQPIDRDHAAKGTRPHEPWVDGPEHEAIRKRYIEERYRLLPYLYTVAEETTKKGLPMMRPLFLEFPNAADDGTPMDLIAGGAEFLLGPNLLIAPNPSPEEVAPYELHLPPGSWYDYWTGRRVGTGTGVHNRDAEVRDALLKEQHIMIEPKLDTVPVYVRGGAIIPLEPLVQSTEQTPQGPLTLKVYLPGPGQSCEGEVYADDGHSLDYTRGHSYRLHASCTVATNGAVTVALDKPEGPYRPWWQSIRLQVIGKTASFSSATVDGSRQKLSADNSLIVPTSSEPVRVVLR